MLYEVITLPGTFDEAFAPDGTVRPSIQAVIDRIDGERVADVTTDPRFAGAAHSIAELFDIQGEPDRAEAMTFESPTSGERVGLSFLVPRSRERNNFV